MFHQTNTILDDIFNVRIYKINLYDEQVSDITNIWRVFWVKHFGNSSVNGFCQTPLYT